MRAALLAAVLCAAPAAAEDPPRPEVGARLGWLTTTGFARDALTSGAPEGEVYVSVSPRPRSPLALEASLSAYSLSGTESGVALFHGNGGTVPTSFSFGQTMLVMPLRLTAKVGPRGERWSAHVGAGVGGVFSDVTRTLLFSDSNAQSTLGQTTGSADFDFETHAQAGVDYKFGDHIGAGLLARWSYARSNVALYHGFEGASPGVANFSDGRSAGNVSGLFLGASVWWRF
jgi:hypothetical protein